MPVTGALETKTIKRLRTAPHKLVKIYKDVPQIFLEYTNKLSLTPESHRQKIEGAILLKEAARGNYWVVSTEEEEVDLLNQESSVNVKQTQNRGHHFSTIPVNG
jgi:hypothetical protein